MSHTHKYPAGTSIAGRYQIISVLGDGSTGVVYEVKREGSDKACALKIMHPHLAGDAQVRGRFTREARILERLRGDHLCPVIESGEFLDPSDTARHLLYLAMPKLATESLASKLARDEVFSTPAIIALMQQVCAALRSAHSEGVIHRDLKPENVLIDDKKHVTVIDFGMAKIVQGSGMETTNLTAVDMVFGTPEYMSPEQARGDTLDARCDIYAAGIILYELVTGALPFVGNSPLAILSQVVAIPARPPREATTRVVPAALNALTMHAIAKEPNQRYASAMALSAALSQVVTDPYDETAVNPAFFGTATEQSDAHAATMPELPSMKRMPIPTVVRDSSSMRPLAPERAFPTWAWVTLALLALVGGVALAVVSRSH